MASATAIQAMVGSSHSRCDLGSVAFARILHPERDGRVQPGELYLLRVEQHLHPHHLDVGYEQRTRQWHHRNSAPRFE